MTTRYYWAIFPICGGKAFSDWATIGIPVMIRLLNLTRVDDVMCFKNISFLFLVQKKRLEVNVGEK